MSNLHQVLTIGYVGAHLTVEYACSELRKYLELMTGEPVTIATRQSFDDWPDASLWVGLATDFPGLTPPTVNDARFDDAIVIKTEGGRGVIAGNNPRSTLLAVYRYLHELGCRWVRPGADGEFIPSVDLAQTRVDVSEAASYRHRGICIEGAVSYEHVRDVIEWMPKVGFNGYFIQFREGYTFFDRWYSHKGSPFKQPEAFSVRQARSYVDQLAVEIKKRDLLFHAVGHGWTCEPFGILGLGWEYPPEPVPPDAVQYLALVNGKRELWEGIALNTNLCYSNPAVRRMVSEAIVEYEQAHPRVDILHFWLADGANNHCECENCRDTRPADFYVMMLNEVDRLLAEHRLNTRIVFLIYFDLLWPPERERIDNPDHFILMFAPITRTYSKTFSPGGKLPDLAPYVRNRLAFPRNVDENVAFLRAWQGLFDGDSFDFDYHLMWDHYFDPGYTQVALVLHKDIALLHELGLNGYMSCQVQRAFFPTGLPMCVMGWTLWDKARDFDSMARDYFAAAFGPDGQQAYDYLTQLSDLFDPVYLRGEKRDHDAQAASSFQRIPEVIAAFRSTIEWNCAQANRCWAASWQLLRHHAEIAEALAQTLEARALGHDEWKRRWEAVKEWVWQKEEVLHPVFDPFLFVQTFERGLNR